MTYSKKPTKSELINIIKSNSDLKSDEICLLFGWKTRTQFMKLCAAHEIIHTDYTTYRMSGKVKITSEQLSDSINHFVDDLTFADELGISINSARNILDEYGISYTKRFQLNDYDTEVEQYKNGISFIETVKDLSHFKAYFRRAVAILKTEKWPETDYSIDYCRKLLGMIDLTGRGFIKRIECDPVLYRSIENHISDDVIGNDRHGNKNFLERVYLILNPAEIGGNWCALHDKPIKFYNLIDGYADAGCDGCHKRGYSQISQDLFNAVSESITLPHRYASKGGEKRIRIHIDDITKYSLKTRYFLDFVCGNKKYRI